MVEIIADVLPRGYRKNKRNLGRIRIYNDGTGTPNFGNYGVEIYDKDGKKINNCKITCFDRANDDVWKLLHLSLEKMIGGKNG